VGIGGHACREGAGSDVTVFSRDIGVNEGLLATATEYGALTNSTFDTVID